MFGKSPLIQVLGSKPTSQLGHMVNHRGRGDTWRRLKAHPLLK